MSDQKEPFRKVMGIEMNTSCKNFMHGEYYGIITLRFVYMHANLTSSAIWALENAAEQMIAERHRGIESPEEVVP